MPIVTASWKKVTRLPRRSGGGDLGDVDRGDRGGDTDRDTDDEARDEERVFLRRQPRGDGADDEDDRRGDDQALAAELVAVLAGEPGTRDRAERHRTDDGAGRESADAEIGLDLQEGAGDDAGVVAEQQSGEAGDRGNDAHVPARDLFAHPFAEVSGRAVDRVLSCSLHAHIFPCGQADCEDRCP